MMFQFIYSKRDGTPAAKSEEQVPDEIKSERFRRLLSVQEPIAEALSQKYLGKTIRVLCEGKSKNNPEKYTGRDTKMKIVLFDGDESMTGKFVDIKINEAHAFALYGEAIK